MQSRVNASAEVTSLGKFWAARYTLCSALIGALFGYYTVMFTQSLAVRSYFYDSLTIRVEECLPVFAACVGDDRSIERLASAGNFFFPVLLGTVALLLTVMGAINFASPVQASALGMHERLEICLLIILSVGWAVAATLMVMIWWLGGGISAPLMYVGVMVALAAVQLAISSLPPFLWGEREVRLLISEAALVNEAAYREQLRLRWLRRKGADHFWRVEAGEFPYIRGQLDWSSFGPYERAARLARKRFKWACLAGLGGYVLIASVGLLVGFLEPFTFWPLCLVPTLIVLMVLMIRMEAGVRIFSGNVAHWLGVILVVLVQMSMVIMAMLESLEVGARLEGGPILVSILSLSICVFAAGAGRLALDRYRYVLSARESQRLTAMVSSISPDEVGARSTEVIVRRSVKARRSQF